MLCVNLGTSAALDFCVLGDLGDLGLRVTCDGRLRFLLRSSLLWNFK